MPSHALRLRQVVLVTSDLHGVAKQLEDELGLCDPYEDPGVAEFGLENRVFAAGDTFVEVLTPIRDGTAGGRYLERRGGDGGYMAIFQVDDIVAARARVAALGIRVVWQADLPDIAGTHLHPRDVPGAIVSLDWSDPPGSWRWAGPAWTGAAPETAGGVTAVTLAAVDPVAMAARWAEVLGPAAALDGTTVRIDGAGQRIQVVEAADEHVEGIAACELALPHEPVTTTIGGVRFTLTPA